MLDHLIQRAADDATVPGKANTANRVVEVLAKLRNPMVRDLYVRDLAAKLGVPNSQVARMVREAQNQAQRGGAAPTTSSASGSRTPTSSAALPATAGSTTFARATASSTGRACW